MTISTPVSTPRDRFALLAGIILTIGFAFEILFSLGLLYLGLLKIHSPKPEQPLSFFMLAAGTLFLGGFLLPGIYLNFRKYFIVTDFRLGHFSINDLIVFPLLVLFWLSCLILGSIFDKSRVSSYLLLPPLNIMGILLPILFYIHLSLRGMEMPSLRRIWTLIAGDILVSPLMAFVLEGLMVGLFVLIFIFYASLNPDMKIIFTQISKSFINPGQNIDNTMQVFASLAFSPFGILTIYGLFSLAVPLIEESVKVVLILPLLKKKPKPLEGFILGILCGATFAFVESLGFSSAGGVDWPISALTRSTSALPHILNSGLLGYALADATQNHNYWQLLKTFLVVVIIHGAWNAISLGVGLNSLAVITPNSPFIYQFNFPWLAGWVTLIIGIFVELLLINRHFRTTAGTRAPENPGV